MTTESSTQPLCKASYEQGVQDTLERLSSRKDREAGLDISTIKKLQTALSELPDTLEVLDAYSLPLRGEINFNFVSGKALFVYGYRPEFLGEPF